MSHQMDGPQEVASGLVVARGNGPVMLQACEEVLDQMTRLVEVAVIFARLFVRHLALGLRLSTGGALIDDTP